MTKKKSKANSKRILSDDSSAEKMESEAKKTKANSVQELLGASQGESPILPAEMYSPDAKENTTDVSTPCARLSFENLVAPTTANFIPIPAMESAPQWAKDLVTAVNSLKEEVHRVSTIALETQKAIAGAISSNIELSSNLGNVTRKALQMEKEITTLRSENTELKEHLLHLEYHQRRNNLLFDGIPESREPETGRDCYNKIMNIIQSIPTLDPNMIQVDRCHRLGPKQPNKTRSIIARFNWYGDLVEIMNNRSYIPKGIYINEDYPQEWIDRRRLLKPILNKARSLPAYKFNSFLTKDKLVIDGKQFTVAPNNNLCDLPKDIVPSETCEKRNENTIAFLGPHSVFSNFHSAAFTDGGVKYSCSEQMIQAEKAALFGDVPSLQKIMRSQNPYKMKELGGRIHGFSKEEWMNKSKDIVFRAVRAKFDQNPNLGKLLRSTGSVLLVESSPDKIWGTGIHLKHEDALQKSKWTSNGLMSEILSRVRSELNP